MMAADPSIRAVYEQLYADHAGAVLTYLTNRLRDPETAQNLSQDTWEKAFRGLPDVLGRGDTAGKPWLMRIATNAMMDHYRAAKARPQTSDLDDALMPGTAFPDALMDGGTPEDAVLLASEQGEQRAQAAVLLQLLPRDHRKVLWFREWRGYSYAQLAVVLQCTVPAVKARLWRARMAQRSIWQQEREHTAAGSDTLTRLWRHVQGGQAWALAHTNDCWPWLGNRSRGRPGTIGAPIALATGRLQNVSAPRVLYAAVCGVLPAWAYLSPVCPMLGCINPFHRRIVSKTGRGGRYRPTSLGLDRPDAAEAPWLTASAMRQRRLALAVTTLWLSREAGIGEGSVWRMENRLLVDPPALTAIEAALTRLEARLTPLTIGTPERLRARRLAAGLTRSQLVGLSGVSWRTVHRLETIEDTKASSCRRRLQDALDHLEAERTQVRAA